MSKVLIRNIKQLATPIGNVAACGEKMNYLKIVNNAAVYVEDGIIKMVGAEKEILLNIGDLNEIRMINAEGKAVLPGFIDSHTHFIFGGYREDEFVDRIEGIPYLELLNRGGGIQTTVEATRQASYDQLKDLGKKRVQEMLVQGITTMEGKSGYGLDKVCELKQLRIMKELNESMPIDIISTYLGAHAIPKEYIGKSGEYISYMIDEVIPRVKKEDLADYVDVFCEDSVFSIEESRKLLNSAMEMGLKTKIHADEIVSLGGAELAAQVGVTSADHLLMISDRGIEELKEKKVVATLLPNTAFCLAKPYAPARRLIDCGVAVALASDFNPGSCFSNSIPLLMALAVIHMKMTLEEAITAITLNGAAALNRADIIGTIEVGKKADMVILNYDSYKFLVYHTGVNIVKTVIKNGEVIYEA